MPIKEISTKLTSEELEQFLEICKNRNCTPSDLIKKLVLSLIETSEKKQATEESSQSQTKPHAAKTEQQTSLDESTTIEIIKKIENDEASEEELQELYVKLGEKLEKNSLTKPEEALFRKVHQKLRDMLLKHVAQTKTLNVEERFQYF
jgi:tRNA C32,U32 (ribose-2'-O)-methylase TrmJ